MKRYLFMLAVCGVFLGGVRMAQASENIFPYDYTVKKLDNGLTVIMIPMSGAKGVISYYSIVRTGSRDEYEAGHSGFAHFFEHMMFRGTKKYPGNVYDKLVTEMGANANAYTTDDYTCYHMTFAKKYLSKVMELESDRFQNLFYAEPEFQTEAGAVYGEYRKNVTSPWMVLFEKLQETAFDVHTYKHTTMGFERDIKAMPQMYVYSQEFFKRYYRPENVVLMVTGDVDMDETMKLINQYYGKWEAGYVTPNIPVEPPQKGARETEVHYPGKTLPMMVVAYKGPAFNPADKKMLALTLLGDIAFGQTSAINKKLTLKEQKVTFIGGEFGINRDPNLSAIYTMVKNPADAEYVKNEILSTVEHFRTNLVSDKELQNTIKHRKYSFLMNLDTPEKTANALTRYIAITGGIEAVNTMFKTLETITPADLQEAANTWLIPDSRTIITLKGAK